MSNLPRFFGGRDWASFRQMGDEVGSLDGFRTRTRIVGDELITMRTKGGMPIVIKENLLTTAPIERLFPAFLARPVSEQQRTGPYAMWSRWNTTGMPPGALTPLDTTIRSGNHTWYSAKFHTSNDMLAVVSWCGTPWRYGTYSTGNEAAPFNIADMAAGNGDIGAPFIKSDQNWYGRRRWRYSVRGAFAPFSKAVWLNTTKIPTSKPVYGAGLRRIGDDCYLYYFGVETQSLGPGSYGYECSIRRMKIGVVSASQDYVVVADGAIGADELVATLDLSVLPSPTTALRQNQDGLWVTGAYSHVEQPEPVQMAFFNDSCTECCTLVSSVGKIRSWDSAQNHSICAIRVSCDTGVVSVDKTSKFEVVVGEKHSSRSDVGDIVGEYPNIHKWGNTTSTASGQPGYKYTRRVLMCDWLGDELEMMWYECQSINQGMTSSYNSNYDEVVTHSVSQVDNLRYETNTRSFTASISESFSLTGGMDGPLGSVDRMTVASNIHGILFDESLPQKTLAGSAGYTASYSDSATSIFDTNLNQYVHVESLEPLPEPPYSGSASGSSSSLNMADSMAYVCDGDIRCGVLAWGVIFSSDHLTYTESGSNPQSPTGMYLGMSMGASHTSVVTEKHKRVERAKVFDQQVSGSDNLYEKVTTSSGASNYLTAPGVFLDMYRGDTQPQQLSADWCLTSFGAQIPVLQVLGRVLDLPGDLGNAYPEVCGVATAKTPDDSQYVYVNLQGVDLPESQGVRWEGFAKKVGGLVSLHNTADNYSPSGDMRALARPVFLPKGST